MPHDTQFGKFNTGKDVSLDIVLKSGRHLTIGNITDFDAKPKNKDLSSLGIDGINRYSTVPEGWQLSFTMDRTSRELDDFWATFEEGYYNGDVVQNCTVLQTIREGDGSISQWRYEGVALDLEDAGNWKSDAYVKQKIKGMASLRRRVQ